MQLQIFTQFSNQYDTVITNVVQTNVQHGLGVVAPYLADAAGLAVVVMGCLMMFRQMPVAVFVWTCVGIAAVSLLLTYSYYDRWVIQPFLNAIPNALGMASGGTGSNAAAGQFDTLMAGVMHTGSTVLQSAQGWAGEIKAGIAVSVMVGATGVILAVSFIMWEFAREMVGLLLCVGPYIIPLYLIRRTREVVSGWIGALIGLMVLYVFVAVLLQIVVAGNSAFIQYIANASYVGTDEEIMSLVGVMIFFFMSTVLFVLAPIYAARIGGGVVMHVRSILPKLPRG